MRAVHSRVIDSLFRLASKAHKLPADEMAGRLLDAAGESGSIEDAFDEVPMGVMVISGDGTQCLKYANKAACRILAMKGIEDMKDGRGITTANSISPIWDYVGDSKVSDFLRRALAAVRNDGVSFAPSISEEFSVTSASGNVHFIIVAVQGIWNNHADGAETSTRGAEVQNTLITVQDVTQRRLEEVRTRRMESLAELTTLAANMAHEIKNPLGAISIHVQLVQKALERARRTDGIPELPDEKFLEEPLRVVSEEVDSLNALVMQFLMAVRPINAKLEMLDVCAIVTDTIAFVSPEFERHGFAANADMPTAEGEEEKAQVRLLLDGRLMKEVLINMAQNALYALISRFENSEGADTGRFDIAVRTIGDNCVITVSDNGAGMTQEVTSRIFEPYFTTKADGTGLGMTMVYKIIKEFGGSIDVRSRQAGANGGGEGIDGEETAGTAFTIRIPLPQMGKIKGIEYTGSVHG